jgi:hypothetical protein
MTTWLWLTAVCIAIPTLAGLAGPWLAGFRQ